MTVAFYPSSLFRSPKPRHVPHPRIEQMIAEQRERVEANGGWFAPGDAKRTIRGDAVNGAASESVSRAQGRPGRAVAQINCKTRRVMRTFDSLQAAADSIGVFRFAVHDAIRSQTRCKGRRFKWAEDTKQVKGGVA